MSTRKNTPEALAKFRESGAAYRNRQREKGMRKRPIWVTDEEERLIREYVATLRSEETA